MSIASKLEYLDKTKDYIRQCIQQKGVTVPSGTTFRQYGDKILEIETEKHPPDWEGEGGSSGKLIVGTALATGQDFVLSPSEGYDGFSQVNVMGDVNLKPENIAKDVTIYGVTGTMEDNAGGSGSGGELPSYDDTFIFTMRVGNYGSSYPYAVGFDVTSIDGNIKDDVISGTLVVIDEPSNVKTITSLSSTTPKWSYGAAYDGKLVRITLKGRLNIISNLLTLVSIDSTIPPTINNVSLVSSLPVETSFSYGGPPGRSTSYTFNSSESMFSGSSIETLPNNVFSKMDPYISNLNSLFQHSSIKSLPDGLFSNFKYVQKADCMFAYTDSIEQIPENLFYGMTELYSVKAMFYNSTSVKELPANLFSTNVNLEDCSYMFAYSQISKIPAGLLANAKKLNNCKYMFWQCRNIHRLDNSFLPDSENSIDLSYMFYCCRGLTSISESFFSDLNNILSMNYMFSGCTNMTGIIPELWNDQRFADIPHEGCFEGCSLAKNYKDVPYEWGGGYY